jgi:hypothetical protein
MTRKNAKLPVTVRDILKGHGYENMCHPLFDLAERLDETRRNISVKIFVYKWSSLIILIFVPVISTILSICSSHQDYDNYSGQLRILTFILTFLALMNSIFRPSLRFKALCEMGMGVQEVADDFLSAIETLPSIREERLHELSELYNKLLIPYERQLISFFLPTELSAQGSRGTLAAQKREQTASR